MRLQYFWILSTLFTPLASDVFEVYVKSKGSCNSRMLSIN